MEDEEEQPNIPFWLQESTTELSNDWSSMVFNLTSFLIILIVMIGLWINFCIIPKMIRLMHRICNSKSLKRDLESLNIILILFAVICGILTQLTSNPEEDNNNNRTRYTRGSPTHHLEDEQNVWNNTRNPDGHRHTTEIHKAECIEEDESEIYYDADQEEEITPQLFSTSLPQPLPPPPYEIHRQWVTSAPPPPSSPYARLWAPSAPPPEPSYPVSAEREYIIHRKRIGFMKRVVSAIRIWIRRDYSDWFDQFSHPQSSSVKNASSGRSHRR